MGWTPLQTQLIEALLDLLDPGAARPRFSPQAAANVNKFLHCRQWLLHAGPSLLDPHEGHDKAWLHWTMSPKDLDLKAKDLGLDPKCYRTTAGWDLYKILSSVTEEPHPAGPSNELCERSHGALVAAKEDIFASLESVMAHFKVLHTRDLLFRRALEYDQIIYDLEHNVL